MKKKLILLTTLATSLIIATVAMASGSLSMGEITTEEMFTQSFDALASYMGYDTEEKFEAFHKTALFMGKYCTTKEHFSFIENMILSGCDPQTTMDIYQFYLTTNEPVTIVRQIYDMVYTGEPITKRDVVFENAFNELTNNKCGVLTEEDILSYLEKGLTVSDITEANLLCRKGVMTIQEILDARLEGIEWEKIIKIITGENITIQEENISTVAYAMTEAKITNKPLSTILAEEDNDYFAEKTKEVNSKLKQKGYWKGRKSENFHFLVKDAEKKGISEAELTKLLDQGCTELDLMNAVNDPSCTASTFSALVRNEVSK